MLKIRIETNHDFTPRGKRRIRVVNLRGGMFIRWYVSGGIFRTLKITPDHIALSRHWLESETSLNL
jgi:hypothetical protein